MTKYKHLSLSNRIDIERYLNNNFNFTEVGRLLNKSDRCISKEVKKNKTRIMKKNPYANSPNYICEKLTKPPYVCNGCDTKHSCRKTRYEYYAKDAWNSYKIILKDSRAGINMNADEFHQLNDIVKQDIEKGHSFSMIINNHADKFNVGERTLYYYQEKGYLDTLNIDLPRKVRYKKRKKSITPIIRNSKIRENRTYQDFLKYKEDYFIKNSEDVDVVQMDTVEGKKGEDESVLLTLLFTQSNFLLAFKMESKTIEEVRRVLGNLKDDIGMELFYELFPVILTDNGSEFFDPDYIEDNGPYIAKSKVFYCDSRQSQQKGSLEVTHEFIRRYVEKGKSFNDYSQEDITLMVNNINSIPRDKFGGCSAFQVQEIFTDPIFFKRLNLKKIYGNEVIIKPSLLKKKSTTDNSTQK
jgi:IS30 family transposase